MLYIVLVCVLTIWLEINIVEMLYAGLLNLVSPESALALTLLALVAPSLWALGRLKGQGYAILARIQDSLRSGQFTSDWVSHELLRLLGFVLIAVPSSVCRIVGIGLLVPRLRVRCQKWARNYVARSKGMHGGAQRKQQGPEHRRNATEAGNDDVIDVEVLPRDD